VPLHARTRTDHTDHTGPAEPLGAIPGSGAGLAGRHCWVADPGGAAPPRPGLLVEWRRSEGGGWEGRVAHVAELGPGRWALVEEWLDQSLLSGRSR
jgi:hypothetical protein